MSEQNKPNEHWGRVALLVGGDDSAAAKAAIALSKDVIIVDLTDKQRNESLNDRIAKFEKDAELIFKKFETLEKIFEEPIAIKSYADTGFNQQSRYQRRLQQRKNKKK